MPFPSILMDLQVNGESPLGSQLQHKSPWLHRRQQMCEGASRTEEIPRDTSLEPFKKHLEEMFAVCKETDIEEDLGAG